MANNGKPNPSNSNNGRTTNSAGKKFLVKLIDEFLEDEPQMALETDEEEISAAFSDWLSIRQDSSELDEFEDDDDDDGEPAH